MFFSSPHPPSHGRPTGQGLGGEVRHAAGAVGGRHGGGDARPHRFHVGGTMMSLEK